MAEGGIPLEELDKSNAYDDVKTVDALLDIFNDSTYDTIDISKFDITQKSKIKEITNDLKLQMTHENIPKLNTLIESKFQNIDKTQMTLS
jgi:hypothetical protein